MAATAYVLGPWSAPRPVHGALALGLATGLLAWLLAAAQRRPAAGRPSEALFPAPPARRARRRALGGEDGSTTWARRLLRTARLAALGESFGALCHELRAPAGIILMKARNLLDSAREVPLPPSIERDLERIAHHAGRVGEVAAGVLRAARDPEGPDGPADLRAAVEEALEVAAPRLEEVAVRCECRLVDAPPVRGSRGELAQLALNLVLNAARAAGQGGRVRVEVRPGPDGEGTLVVADDGPGVPSGDEERIFEPFYTTRPGGEGTGLGLYVCACILERHGGRVRVGRAPEGGAEFLVSLPPWVEGPGVPEEVAGWCTTPS
ncbi:MAG: HAMP domain-containing histidine kinase [Planctomycetes bacterium]|nr:HAMP domain-containing histidine kinase [Planctomycetota bacterium]